MAGASLDRIDCVRLADGAVSLQRAYSLGTLPRLRDLLADDSGMLRAEFAFAKAESGRAGVKVTVTAEPRLVCQRCLQGFDLPVTAKSEIEFAEEEEASPTPDSERDLYVAEHGQVSLRDLAEEELLLALPFAPVCSAPQLCGNAPLLATEPTVATEETVRPFSALQELLKKT
jgi:uncharacterized protein